MPEIIDNAVRQFSAKVLCDAFHITVDQERVQELARLLVGEQIVLPTWDDPKCFLQTEDPEEVCRYLMVLMGVNFNFTHFEDTRRDVWFRDGEFEKFFLAAARIAKHWEQLRDPDFLWNVDAEYVGDELFAAEVSIPLVAERVDALREIGHFWATLEHGVYDYLLEAAMHHPFEAACELMELMPGWEDSFVKRAQLYLAMILMRLGEATPVPAERLNEFTVFAETRLPQTGYAMGALKFSSALTEKLWFRRQIAAGSRMERELRAASIVFGDQLLEAFWALGREELTPLHIDNLLWAAQARKDELPEGVFVSNFLPRYRVRTTHC